MAVSTGVFIRSSKRFEEVISACQQLLQTLESDAKIIGFMEASTYSGFKMYFSDDAIVPKLLKKKFLAENDESSLIFPLLTRLTVRKMFPRCEDVFRKELRENLQNLGPVLGIYKIPISPEFADIGTGDWRVVLDVPEVPDFDVFKKFGLPDEMMIRLPSMLVDETLPVVFHCVLCGQNGHTQSQCDHESGSSNNSETAGSDLALGLQGGVPAPVSGRPRRVPRVCIENVMPSTKAFPEIGGVTIKKEIIDDFGDVYNANQSKNQEETRYLLFHGTEDGTIPRGSAEDSVSTSNLSEAVTELVKTEYPSEPSDDPEEREQKRRRKAMYKKRRKPTLDQPIVIPERIRAIIDQTNGPLNADKMEAFFTHTKKKSRPCEMGKIFCPDVAALKVQLETVQTEYFQTNAAPRKEEREFMKWFVGMLQRFDGPLVPPKRSRN